MSVARFLAFLIVGGVVLDLALARAADNDSRSSPEQTGFAACAILLGGCILEVACLVRGGAVAVQHARLAETLGKHRRATAHRIWRFFAWNPVGSWLLLAYAVGAFFSLNLVKS